jgi:hypothetical protein
VTERQSDDVVEILRRRLGARYQSGIDEGRAAMARALRDELSLGADEADALVRGLIDAGQIRYVTSDERDPMVDPGSRDVERPDQGERSSARDPLETGAGLNPIPAQGGPQEGYSGLKAGAALPVSGAGTGSPAAGPLAVAAATGDDRVGDPTGAKGPGYWDIGAGTTGVVPSATRKGQVEPKGTQ